MGLFNKKNPNEKKYAQMRKAAIEELRNQLYSKESVLEFDAHVESSVKDFVKTRNIKSLVDLRIADLNSERGKASIKYSPLVEAVVNFIYADMLLLDAQGDTDHTFEDSVENLIFVMY